MVFANESKWKRKKLNFVLAVYMRFEMANFSEKSHKNTQSKNNNLDWNSTF